MTRLGETPFIDSTAEVTHSTLGRVVEVGPRCVVSRSTLGDYSYCCEGTQIAYADIGKFANIAAHARIYASRHPMDRASLHHFTYRSAWYFEGETDDEAFFEWRAEQRITIGHDTWVGHGSVIMPGVTIGTGAVIGSNAVVTKDVPDFAIAVGVPAKVVKYRFPEPIRDRLLALCWWDWPHDRLHDALADFRSLSIDAFLEKHGA